MWLNSTLAYTEICFDIDIGSYTNPLWRSDRDSEATIMSRCVPHMTGKMLSVLPVPRVLFSAIQMPRKSAF